MYEDELKFANELADEASDIGMGYFRGEFTVTSKADHTPVTEADLEIEAMARKMLAERFPTDAVLGEETGLEGESDRVWVIDPIDGTKNFAGGIQLWATLISLRVDDRPVVGVANAPAIGERYEAIAGQGATLNGSPIHVTDVDTIRRAVVTYGGLAGWLQTPWHDAFVELIDGCRRSRGVGDFWGHMLVARGSAEVMMELELRIWDTSAVQVIVEEAGGRMTALDGSELEDRGSAISTNGKLHDDIIERFRS